MKIYDYLFYKIYKLINLLGNTDFYPEANTWFISSTFVWLNMLTILNFFELRLGRALTNTGVVIVLYVLYLVLNYVYFFNKNRYKDIVQRYDQQTSFSKVRGSLIVGVYILATLVFHFYFAEMRRAMTLNAKESQNVALPSGTLDLMI